MNKTLLALAIPLALSACGEKEEIRDVYTSKAECIREWKKMDNCQETNVNGSGGGGGGAFVHGYRNAYIGPLYSPNNRSANGVTPTINNSSFKVSNFTGFIRSSEFRASPPSKTKTLMYTTNWDYSQRALANNSFAGKSVPYNGLSKNTMTAGKQAASLSASRGTSASRGGFGGGRGGGSGG